MKIIFKIILALVFLLSSASWVVSQTFWGQNRIKQYVQTTLSETLGAKVSIRSVNLFFPFLLRVKGINVTKEHAHIHIDTFSCIPFWLDLPFHRMTLLSVQATGIEIDGSNPEKFLESSTSSSSSLSILFFRLRSLHIANEKIPGKSFDGSLRGSLYLSGSLDHIKVKTTLTRSQPTLWPKRLKVRFSKEKNFYSCSGSVDLNGIATPTSFFGPRDKFYWDLHAKRVEETFQDLGGSWNVYCPTTELSLPNNYVLNRNLQANGSFSYKNQRDLSFFCENFVCSMVFGKNIVVQSDVEGAGKMLKQFGSPLCFKANLSLSGTTNDDNTATLKLIAPSFSCNSFQGALLGSVNISLKDDTLEVSSKSEGTLQSGTVEVPLQFLGEALLSPATTTFSSDLLVSPFHVSNKIEKAGMKTTSWTNLKCQDLSVLQQFLPLLIGGTGEVCLTQVQSEIENTMSLSSHLSDAYFGSFSCTSADLALSSKNIFEKMDVSIDVTSGKFLGLFLEKAHVGCSINPSTLDIKLSDLRLIGKASALSFDLTGSGKGKVDSLQSFLLLDELKGTLQNQKVYLESPFRIECIDVDEMLSQALFSLRVGNQGVLHGEWIHPSPSRSTLELSWRDLPFPIMAALFGITEAQGLVSGECHYQTTPRDVLGSFQMQAHVSRCGALGSPEGELEISSVCSLGDSLVDGTLTVTGTGVLEPLSCSFSLPFERISRTPFITLSHTKSLRSSLKGKAKVSKLFYYWMPEEIGCEAILKFDTFFAGSLSDIQVTGPVSLSEGRMELLATGQVLENITMEGEMNHRTLSVHHIHASDAFQGELTGTGFINFFENDSFLWQAALSCKNLLAVDLPYTSASVDGTLQLDGTANSLLISGNAVSKKAFVDVAARFPSNIPELSVTFTDEKLEEKTPFQVFFDLYFEAPSGGEIRGRGLHSFWKGHAHLSGQAQKLNLAGNLSCTKGTFTIAGKELLISHGLISVNGNLFRDSQLNVLANVSLPTITVQVGLKGSLKSPKFFIQSTPVLPEKEILSLLLFNKEFSDISPLESLQLANAAMTLEQSSGPFDLIDRVKTTLGIDLIDIGSSQPLGIQQPAWSTVGADSEETEGPLNAPQNDVTLKVGKYISNGVAITVSKDVTAGVNRIGLEASLSQHVTANAEIGDDAGGIASLKWKKDY